MSAGRRWDLGSDGLLGRSKPDFSTSGRRPALEVENDISHTIVPNHAIPARAASAAMVAKWIQHVVAQRAKAGVFAFWDAQSVSHLGSKLVGRDRGAFGAVRDRLPYFSSTFFSFGQQRGFVSWALGVVAADEASFVNGG